MTTTCKTTDKNTCEHTVSAYDGEFFGICALPAGHAGDCEYVETMGMCSEPGCRAMRSPFWGDNGFAHNH